MEKASVVVAIIHPFHPLNSLNSGMFNTVLEVRSLEERPSCRVHV